MPTDRVTLNIHMFLFGLRKHTQASEAECRRLKPRNVVESIEAEAAGQGYLEDARSIQIILVYKKKSQRTNKTIERFFRGHWISVSGQALTSRFLLFSIQFNKPILSYCHMREHG